MTRHSSVAVVTVWFCFSGAGGFVFSTVEPVKSSTNKNGESLDFPSGWVV